MSFLKLENISKKFGSLAALDHLNLQVKKGEILGIVGPNGSGKTTLINVISGYYRPTGGTILFEDGRISGLRPDRIAKRGIVRTFQSNVLFPGTTVMESLVISSYLQYRTSNWQSFLNTTAWKKDDKKAIDRIHESLNLLGMVNEMDLPVDGLSHGYQRMLGIVMAMIANPSVLLLDEPTTGMNHEEAMLIVELIRKINSRGITIILIEHNMKVLLGVAERIVCLSFGTKITEGNPEDVMNNPEVVEAYLGTEMI